MKWFYNLLIFIAIIIAVFFLFNKRIMNFYYVYLVKKQSKNPDLIAVAERKYKEGDEDLGVIAEAAFIVKNEEKLDEDQYEMLLKYFDLTREKIANMKKPEENVNQGSRGGRAQ